MPSRRQGSIIQRARGSWQVRYYAPPNANGKQKRLTETVKGNKSAAEHILRDRLSAIENGRYVPKDKETLSQFLDRWMRTYVSTNCTLRTAQGYRAS